MITVNLKKKVIAGCLGAATILLHSVLPTFADDVLIGGDYYAENFGPNALGFPVGLSFQFGISQSLGMVPPIVMTSQETEYDFGELIVDGSYYWGTLFDANGAAILGQRLQFKGQDASGQQMQLISHLLDHPHAMPIAALQLSEACTATPTIAWDPIYHDADNDPSTSDIQADNYRVRIYALSENGFYEIFRSSTFQQTSYTVPEGILQPFMRYTLRMLSTHYENENGVWYVENRSSSFIDIPADFDGDGIGDACDSCPEGESGAVVDDDGCSVMDLCPCDNDWKNHGQYVQCVTRAGQNLFQAGLITGKEKGQMISEAGRSSCGKKK